MHICMYVLYCILLLNWPVTVLCWPLADRPCWSSGRCPLVVSTSHTRPTWTSSTLVRSSSPYSLMTNIFYWTSYWWLLPVPALPHNCVKNIHELTSGRHQGSSILGGLGGSAEEFKDHVRSVVSSAICDCLHFKHIFKTQRNPKHQGRKVSFAELVKNLFHFSRLDFFLFTVFVLNPGFSNIFFCWFYRSDPPQTLKPV